MIASLLVLARRLVAALGAASRVVQDAWLAHMADLQGDPEVGGLSPWSAAVSLTLLLALPLAVGLVAGRLARAAATVLPARGTRRST
jgi:hypothetical protein